MTKAANILTLIGLAIIPLGMFASVVHQAHVYMMMLVCFIGLVLSLPNKWLSGFGLYVSAWWLAVYLMTFTGAWIPELTIITIDAALFLIFAMITFLAVYNSIWENDTWYNIICISALIQCFIGILQNFNLDPVSWALSHFVKVSGEFPLSTATGTLGNQNFLAAYLAISLPFFIRVKWINTIPIIFYGLYISHTSMAWAAVVIGLAYYFGGWKLSSICFCLMGLYAILINPHDGLKNERFDMWFDGIEKITYSWKSIFLGFGPGIQWRIEDQLHNEYLMTIWNYGLIGFSFMTGFILTAYKRDKWLFTAFIILCVDMIGNHVLHTTPTALLAVAIIALMERERHEKQNA